MKKRFIETKIDLGPEPDVGELTFTLSGHEKTNANQFIRLNCENEKVCKFFKNGERYDGPIGGTQTYSFTPNSLGWVIEISCACGFKKDCTNYSCW